MAVGVAAFMGLSMAAPVVQAAGASPARATGSVLAGRAGSPADAQVAGALGISGDIQKVLLNFAAGKLAGFAFNKLGLDKLLGGGDARLDELKAQLNQISNQIQVLQDSLNSIKADLDKLKLTLYTITLAGYVSDIKSLYDTFYSRALRLLVLYVSADLAAKASGQTCDGDDTCKKDRSDYETARLLFLGQFALGDASKYNTRIHDLLMPGPVTGSVMTAFGEYLASNGTGFLTVKDSDAVLSFYNYFADYEALASWMLAQFEGVLDENQPAEFDLFLTQEIYGYQEQEHKALPPQIPPGTVIVLPKNAVDRTGNTKNMPMWGFSPAAGPQPTFWFPSRSDVGVPKIISQLNNTAAGYGFKDWKVPSRAELDALLSRGPADKTAKEFLSSLDAGPQWGILVNSLIAAPFIWTTQEPGSPPWAGSPTAQCKLERGSQVLTNYVHTAVGPTDKPLSGYPAQYQNYDRPDLGLRAYSWVVLTNNVATVLPQGVGPTPTNQQAIDACMAQLNTALMRASSTGATLYATLLATRNTGDVNYLP